MEGVTAPRAPVPRRHLCNSAYRNNRTRTVVTKKKSRKTLRKPYRIVPLLLLLLPISLLLLLLYTCGFFDVFTSLRRPATVPLGSRETKPIAFFSFVGRHSPLVFVNEVTYLIHLSLRFSIFPMPRRRQTSAHVPRVPCENFAVSRFFTTTVVPLLFRNRCGYDFLAVFTRDHRLRSFRTRVVFSTVHGLCPSPGVVRLGRSRVSSSSSP